MPLHLICVVPWPGFADRWKFVWQSPYQRLLRQADYVKYISGTFHDKVFQERNEYLVNHSRRLIAWYEDGISKTWDTIEYAVRQGLEVVTNRPELTEALRAEPEKGQSR